MNRRPRRWVEVRDGEELVSVCTLEDFRKANAETFNADDLADLYALKDGERLGVGGGAAALFHVGWVTDAVDDQLAEIEGCIGIRIERNEEAPLLWAIWSDSDPEAGEIMGAGLGFEEAVQEALDQARAWMDQQEDPEERAAEQAESIVRGMRGAS